MPAWLSHVLAPLAQTQHAVSHVFGLDNLSGPFYGWWSGAGSDLSELTLAGAAVGLIHHHNCHVHGCWRPGRHSVAGGRYKVCRRCAQKSGIVPDEPITLQHIAEAHVAHKAGVVL